MKRVLTCSVFAVSLLMPVFAQSQQTPDEQQQLAEFGVYGGAALDNVQSDVDEFDDVATAQPGFSAGVQGLWQLANVFLVQSELGFARRGWDMSGNALGQNFDGDYTFSYLELPVMLGATASVVEGIRPKLMVGPHANYFLDGSRDGGPDPFTSGDDIDGDSVNDLQFGVTGAVGANFEIGRMTFTGDIRYKRNLTGVFEATGQVDSIEQESWQLTLGFLF